MTTRYLLDTNVLSELMRHPDGPLAEQIAKIGGAQVCTSIVVVAELQYGVAKTGSRRFAAQLAAILDGLDVLPFKAQRTRPMAW